LRRPGAWQVLLAAVAWLGLALMPCGLAAQTFDATNLHEPTELAATWLVHAGDDPAYARPDLDDSGWMKFDSTKDLHDLFPHDHPEIVWYRLHVRVLPTQTGLALAEWYIAPAFEVYVNGERIMQCGRVAPYRNYVGGARLLESISDRQVATGSFVIAARVHIARSEWGSNPGLNSANLTLGQEHALWEHIWLAAIGTNLFHWISLFAGTGLGLVALVLFIAQPSQRVYLWIFLTYFTDYLLRPIEFIELFHNVPAAWHYAIYVVSMVVSLNFLMRMYFAFLDIPFGRWIQAILAVVIASSVLGSIGSWLGSIPSDWVTDSWLPYDLLMMFVPILFVIQFRRGNREAGILLFTVILYGLSGLAGFLTGVLGQVVAFAPMAQKVNELFFDQHAGPFTWRVFDLFGILFVISLTLIIVLRSTRISRRQAVVEGELDAAREVQQVIVPEQIESIPGFAVESVYLPAQQVGGDFFQILPDSESGLMVVVGDVAGKGLPAAMLVSVLVGAIRTAVEFTKDPAELLGHLNERLLGRTKGGFSTTIAARITAEGMVTIANAGHLSPYLDGREVELPGALPLGILKGARYEATRFTLKPGSRLTFYTDGVVEAQNAAGELFGFERGRTISTRAADVIVEEAKKFGQSDDITVVIVERVSAALITRPTLAIAGESMASLPPA
jgi:sigma-B regulation protein RsbU (phosphoserine phosphatase)